MSLTPEQEVEARAIYVWERLSGAEQDLVREFSALDAEIEALDLRREVLVETCAHPLIVRTTKNDGWTNDWDRTSAYWTNHECGICRKRWATTQRWKHVGGRQGHPDDLEAKCND